MAADQRTIRLTGERQRDYALSLISAVDIESDRVYECVIKPADSRRTSAQNRKQWPMLNDIALQRQLCINGALVWASADDWKYVLTAGFRNEMRVADGVDGHVVMLPARTSRMRKSEFAEWIEYLYAWSQS